MTLADFLLARIAEDEAEASASHAIRCSNTNPCYEEPSGKPDDALCDCRQRRVLDDCEAKRRIVKFCRQEDMPPTDIVLFLLAQPYADHPDFEEDWIVHVSPPRGSSGG